MTTEIEELLLKSWSKTAILDIKHWQPLDADDKLRYPILRKALEEIRKYGSGEILSIDLQYVDFLNNMYAHAKDSSAVRIIGEAMNVYEPGDLEQILRLVNKASKPQSRDPYVPTPPFAAGTV